MDAEIFTIILKRVFILTQAIIVGFSQVCGSHQIRKFMEKGLQVANKHIGLFSSLLLEDNLHSPKLMDSEGTNSSIVPKLAN